MAGLVFSETRRLDKPGLKIPDETPLEVKGKDHPWVSRGGLKLVHGLDHFAVDASALVCLDVGASTGGFTDVLLSRGAARVFAVDVGHGQFAWKLRNDARVVLLERTNARDLSSDLIADPIDLIVCDVSFIGLEKALPAALALAAPGARLVTLIKPQFEVGKGMVGKGGVVRDRDLHRQVCERMQAWLEALPGWTFQGITESPITGPRGNHEFLMAGQRNGDQENGEGHAHRR